MTQHFDVAVIGGQSSGLIAAALLAKRGRRVVLLDHGENTTYYRRKGLRLPLVPTLVPFFESSPPVQKVHDELGLGPDLRSACEALDPLFQAIMPDHRIDIRGDRDALLEELGQEFPESREATARFFDGLFALDTEISAFLEQPPPLPAVGIRDHLKNRASIARAHRLDAPFKSHTLLAGFAEDHPLRDLLLGPLAFFGHLGDEDPSTLHAVRLIARFFRGVLGFADRLGGLQAVLLKVAEQSGVEIQRGAVVSAIALKGRRLARIKKAASKHEVTADFFVASTLGPFQELLPAARLPAKYAVNNVRPSGSLLVLNLVVQRRAMPRGMGQALFLLNGRRTARANDASDPPMFLRRYPARRGEAGPVHTAEALDDEDHEVLSVACPVRTADVSRSPERLAALKQQMIERVGRVVPFLRSFIVDASLPVDTGAWDLEGDDIVRRVDPWSLHPIFAPAERPLLGVASRAVRTVFKNAVHCGRDVFPGLGLEGEYLTALAAADALGDIAGKAWRKRT